MKSAVLAAVACLALPLSLAAQEWVEVRFDRVHLRNGNFIDGQIIARSDASVTMRIVGGEITFKYGMIDRIELVKMKDIKQKEILIDKPKGPVVKPPTDTPNVPKPPEVKGDVRAQVLAIVKKWRAAGKDARFEVQKELIPLGPEAATVLLNNLEAFVEAELQGLVEPTVSELKPDGAAALIQPALKSPKASLRASAATMLGDLNDRGSTRDIAALLTDVESKVRGAAIGSLHKLKATDAIESIAKLGVDPDQGIRNIAMAITIDLCREANRINDTIYLFKDLLNQAKGDVKADIALSLGRTNLKEAADPLVQLLRDDNANARSMALVSLANLDARQVSNDIADNMRAERDRGTRIYYITTSQALKIRKSIPILLDWMEDQDEGIRTSAQGALRAISNQNLGIDIAAWRAWWASIKTPED